MATHNLNPKSKIIAGAGVSGAGGPTGAQGVAGPTGPTGAAGPTGNLGIKGESADLHFLSLGLRCSIACHLAMQTYFVECATTGSSVKMYWPKHHN